MIKTYDAATGRRIGHAFFAKLRERRAQATRSADGQPARWNYLPARAEVGTVVVGTSVAPACWARSLKGERIECVRVSQDGHEFFLDNRDGSGYRKVFELGGGPDSPHNSVPVDDPETFIPDDSPPMIKVFSTPDGTRWFGNLDGTTSQPEPDLLRKHGTFILLLRDGSVVRYEHLDSPGSTWEGPLLPEHVIGWIPGFVSQPDDNRALQYFLINSSPACRKPLELVSIAPVSNSTMLRICVRSPLGNSVFLSSL